MSLSAQPKKHYTVPKLLLCHYSSYFDKCFNGDSVEGKTQKLILDEDKVADFSILLEYMYHGVLPPPLQVRQKGQKGVERCMTFLEYADKYNLGCIGDIVAEPLRLAAAEGGNFKPGHVELVFRVSPIGSVLWDSITKTVLGQYGLSRTLLEFSNELDNVPGFATLMMRQLNESGHGKHR